MLGHPELFPGGLTPSTPSFQPPGRAADSSHRYEDDIAAAKALKLQVYRFSIGWPRVLPDGDPSNPNTKGVNYYNNLIDGLISSGIQPMVTMYHFDYPMAVLRANGTWAERTILEPFLAYADFLFKTFGDRVKLWTTINEPNYYCSTFALIEIPGLYTRKPGDDWKCVHNTILGHAMAYRLYEKHYRATQGGHIGGAALALWSRPNSTAWVDVEAAQRANEFSLGAMYHPLVYGEYPPSVRARVDYYSKLEGLSESRLPQFTAEEKHIVKGAADFLCFNAYFGTNMADGVHADRPRYGTMDSDRDAIEVGFQSTPGQMAGLFMRNDPYVLWEAPRWIYKNYKLPIFITENGWGDERPNTDGRRDSARAGYHSEYLHQLLRVMKEEGVPIMGYVAWSLIDTWEWSAQTGRRFGLVHVDYANGSLDRSLKESAWFFQYIGETRRVPKVEYRLGEAAAGAPATAAAGALVLLTLLLIDLANN
ncbi:hypothetical protein ONE63_000065 [Megalurothrips usitatus]|uniref:Myrosinase 1-like n=1 Tax=Megalurothrips usitatus TaxID=439358 RepID=A0AAV7Y169_9NEOP|nr:hypothetical protein ONE63_000065 [Megalurothrips usitatus]